MSDAPTSEGAAKQKAYQKAYRASPEGKAKQKAYNAARNATPEGKAMRKAYNAARYATPEGMPFDEYIKRLEAQVAALTEERDALVSRVEAWKADCLIISTEFGLPQTMRPAPGEVTRLLGYVTAMTERAERAERECVALRAELTSTGDTPHD